MKKIYLGLGALALGTLAFGQQGIVRTERNTMLPFIKKAEVKESAILKQEKALGFTFWTDDFSTPSNWVIDNAGETAPMGWTIDQTVDSWFFTSAISSTSGGNFAELYNGNPSTGSPAPANGPFTVTTASSIDVTTLAGTSQVSISFQQYGALFQDNQEVQVSTDGVTWVTVGDNSDITPLTQGGGAPYANPMTRTFNIANAIASNPSTVWIRFSWSPDVQNITYGWMIDDVELVTSPDHDLELVESKHGSTGFWGAMLPYYQIPFQQITGIDFMGVVSNKGAQDQTNTQILVDVNTGAFTANSATGFTSTTTSTDTLFTTTQFTPSASAATFNYTVDAESDNVDDVPTNNSASDAFEVTEFIYARDNGSADGGSFNSGEAYEIGNIFDIYATDTIYSVNITVGTNSEGSPLIYGKLYAIDAGTGDFLFLEQTDDYQVSSSEISSGAEITLPLLSPQTLNANESYLLVVGAYGDGGATNDFVTATGGEAEAQTVFYFDGTDQTWYYTTSCPMVRMNMDEDEWIAAGIEEVETNFNLQQNIPNPATGNTSIFFEMTSADDVMLSITDLNGKLIETINVGKLPAGNHVTELDISGYASGMYYYTLSTSVTSETKKMIVK